jgi:ParB-like chromosome segregation protein Spo0J
MNVEIAKIDDLTLDPNNARLHPEENIADIESSLKRFGQVLPLVVWEGIVVGGNGTLTAMRRLDWGEVKYTNFEGTEEEARALAIALNQTATKAVWDPDVLGEALVELEDLGFSAESLGFGLDDIEKLFPAENAQMMTAEETTTKKRVEFEASTGEKGNTCPNCGHTW